MVKAGVSKGGFIALGSLGPFPVHEDLRFLGPFPVRITMDLGSLGPFPGQMALLIQGFLGPFPGCLRFFWIDIDIDSTVSIANSNGAERSSTNLRRCKGGVVGCEVRHLPLHTLEKVDGKKMPLCWIQLLLAIIELAWKLESQLRFPSVLKDSMHVHVG